MNKKAKLALAWIGFAGIFITSEAIAQEQVYLPLNSARLRALSLGGAANGLQDDLGALQTNPAAYSLYRENKDFRVTFFLSPLAPMIIAKRPMRFFEKSVSGFREHFTEFLALFKGVNITLRGFDFAVSLFEPAFIDSMFFNETDKLHLDSVYKSHFNTFAVRFRLAQEVSIGASLHVNYSSDESGVRKSGIGASYGVLLKPANSLNVGVSLFIAPEETPEYRMQLEGLGNESLNIGAAWFARKHLRFLFGLQNIAVSQDSLRETVHAGVEKLFFSQVALRGGIRYQPEENAISYSAGVGLLNLNRFWNPGNKFVHENFFLNYAVLRKELTGKTFYIHGFHVQLRF